MNVVKAIFCLALVLVVLVATLMSAGGVAVAQLGGCESNCVARFIFLRAADVVARTQGLEIESTNIGNSLSTYGATNAASLAAIQSTNAQGFTNVVNETHTLHERIETLNLQQENIGNFGSVSEHACFVSAAAGAGSFERDSATERVELESVTLVNQTETKSGSRRVRDWREIEATPEELADMLSTGQNLEGTNLPKLVKVVTEHKTFPYPSAKTNAPSENYSSLFRERNEHLKLARAAILEHIQESSLPVPDETGPFVASVRELAGLEEGVSKRDFIEAAGHLMFGSPLNERVSSTFGDELIRDAQVAMGTMLYLKAQNNELMASIDSLKQFRSSIKTDKSYDLPMRNALNNQN